MQVENPGRWAIALLVGAAFIALGWRFLWALIFLHVMICFLLVVVVLLQSGKAADLAGAFGGAGSQTAFGPRGATNFLSRATTWCAIMFMATSMTLVKRQAATPGSMGSILERLGTKPAPTQQKPATPGIPVQVPVPVPQSQQPGQPISQTPFSPSPQQQAPAQTTPAQTAPAAQTPPPQPPPAKKP
ncbi:MAG TPA: preprotein translocase subunit SecG [Candidatus Acidoferrales bacterium]|nr:preprotein translocase subunit SecG [Candidatus Acidoferrales bacterium]